MDPTQVCAGGGTFCPWERVHGLFVLVRKTQKRVESGLKNFCIFIFLIVVQDEPYKIAVTYFSERFSEIILKSV